MRCSTQAIVLSIQRHTDTCWWVQLYTEKFGRLLFRMYGRKYRSLFFPLSVVEIETDEPSHYSLPSIHKASLVFTPRHLPVSVQRQSVALFLSEVIAATLQHPLQEVELYRWLETQIQTLDSERFDANFHIRFLQQFTHFLGIGIDRERHPEWDVMPSSRENRRERVQALCAYYQQHIESFPYPKSLPVLMEVFEV